MCTYMYKCIMEYLEIFNYSSPKTAKKTAHWSASSLPASPTLQAAGQLRPNTSLWLSRVNPESIALSSKKNQEPMRRLGARRRWPDRPGTGYWRWESGIGSALVLCCC